MDLSWIGGVAQAGASLYDTYQNAQTAEENLNWQKEAFAQNQANWRENFDYQKALQERIFDREDTSYQRTVSDMRQAGLNPLTMNGTNGGGEAIATSPLQQNAIKNEKVSNTAKIMGDLIGTMNGIQNYQVGISYGKEQEAKARMAQTQAFIDQLTAIDKIKSSDIDRQTKEKLFEDFERNMQFNKDYNLFNGMDNNSRDARIMQALYNGNEAQKDFATDYMLSGLQYNGLKLGGLTRSLFDQAGEAMGKDNTDQIKDEINMFTNPKKMWEYGKNYYKKNWNEYGWNFFKYHDWE